MKTEEYNNIDLSSIADNNIIGFFPDIKFAQKTYYMVFANKNPKTDADLWLSLANFYQNLSNLCNSKYKHSLQKQNNKDQQP